MLFKEQALGNSLELKKDWLKNKGGICLLSKDPDNINYQFLQKINFLKQGEPSSKLSVITPEEFQAYDLGQGWCIGGAESFYQVWKIDYSNFFRKKLCKYLALKAVHSTGGTQVINDRVLSEAIRLVLLSRYDRAPKVFAVSPGVIYREYLLADKNPNLDTLILDAEDLLRTMFLLGIQLIQQDAQTAMQKSVSVNNRLFLVDGGSADLSGPDNF